MAVSVNGSHSTWGEVTSGVHQGSVLDPALFLLYVNDNQDTIQSSMRLFADDSIVYPEIRSQEDHIVLQRDLEVLSNWSSTWLMQISVSKCCILTITKKLNIRPVSPWTDIGESRPETAHPMGAFWALVRFPDW